MVAPQLDNYYVASVTFREVGLSGLEAYFFKEPEKLMINLSSRGVQCIILQTCNRVEIYCYGGDPLKIFEDLGIYSGYRAVASLYKGVDVFRHLIKVVSGLDSLAIGEHQVFGQVRKAYNKAKELGCVGGELDYLFREAFRTGRKIRSKIMFGVFDYASATMEIVRKYVDGGKLLIIGTGDMAKDLLDILIDLFRDKYEVYVCGRSKLEEFSSRYNVAVFHLFKLKEYISDFDIIISCVSSDKPVINDEYNSLIKDGALLIDLGVQPNIYLESCDNFRLYSFEDISRLIESHYRSLSDKLDILFNYVEEEVNKFLERFRFKGLDDYIKRIYLRAEDIRREELSEAYKVVNKIVKDEDVRAELYRLLDRFSWSLVKKIYHSHVEIFRRIDSLGGENGELLMKFLENLVRDGGSCG